MNLQQVFGDRVISNKNTLVINKNDLQITSDFNNSAQQLLAAIIINTVNNFQGFVTTPSGELLTDENNQGITYDNSQLYEVSAFLWRKQLKNHKIQHIFVFELDDLDEN